MQNRAKQPWSDIVSDFLDYTDCALSPELFRKWSGICLVGGALERRCWVKNGPRRTYGNLYCLLVAPPGVGKQVVDEVKALWAETKEPGTGAPIFKVAPDSLTKASLIDRIAKSTRRNPIWCKDQEEFHSLLIAAEEFPVLMPSYDLEYIGTLNKIFNNPPKHEEERRHGKHQVVEIVRPQLHILGATQPGWLASVFPEEAWSMGLTSRMLMIYQSEGELKNIFEQPTDHDFLREKILIRLGQLSQAYGEWLLDAEAEAFLLNWHMERGPPCPTHSKLQHYASRRTQQVLKLSLISALSSKGPGTHLAPQRTITIFDVRRAMSWLFEAEALMPDIFRAMIGKSDNQVLEELHFMLMGAYASGGKKPIGERLIWNFLAQRVPSDKIARLIEVADRSNIIARVAGTNTFLPRPKHEHGVE